MVSISIYCKIEIQGLSIKTATSYEIYYDFHSEILELLLQQRDLKAQCDHIRVNHESTMVSIQYIVKLMIESFCTKDATTR